MSELSEIAADLLYAGTTGAKQLQAKLVRGGAVTAELGVHVPGGSGLLGRGSRTAGLTQADVAGTANAMAVRAANGGVSLVKGHR